MNTKIKNTIKTLSAITLAILVSVSITNAIGTLTPGDTPGEDTQYTTNDIFNKLTDFSTTTTEGTGAMTIPQSVSATFATLSDIYELLEDAEADLVPENIADNVTIFGVEGTLEGATELEWSADQGSMNWSTASTTCAALTEGGATAGDWRLPTISELLAGISDDWIIENDSEGDRFANSTYYWSGTEVDSDNAWYAIWVDDVSNGSVSKNNTYSVRCVR